MSVLRLRAEEGVRRVALGLLAEAQAALVRVREGADDEALHDLRVALRRLRSTLRAHPDAVRGAIPKKRRALLRELVQFTSEGRDAEVQLAWVQAERGSLGARDRAGADAWAERLAAVRDRVYGALRAEKLDTLERLLDKLVGDLSAYDVRFVVNEEQAAASFGELVASAALVELDELGGTLARVRSLEDEAIAHEARIVGKRLRYVLEPVRDAMPELEAALKELKRLQELLGELQDLAVRTAALSQAIEAAALDRARTAVGLVVGAEPADDGAAAADAEPGLLTLLGVAQARKRALFDEILSAWVEGPELALLVRQVEGACGALRTAARGGHPVEIERKYLLTGVPPFVRGKPYARLAQGYVPGEAILERVRKKSDASGTKYFRTVKLGRGIERIEIEEKITRALYTKLWPLTVGRRVEKRRYAIEDGALTWEIDVFTDRELVLCEVELERADTEVRLPDWLAPWVERDVTDEDTYVNANLAR
jgi:CHAD domain-containing protein/CYTH domain-containing protein